MQLLCCVYINSLVIKEMFFWVLGQTFPTNLFPAVSLKQFIHEFCVPYPYGGGGVFPPPSFHYCFGD